MRPPCTRCDDAGEKCSGLPGEKCGRCKRNHGKCSHATRGRGGTGTTGGPTTATTSALGEAVAGGEGTAAGAAGVDAVGGEGEDGEEEDSDEEDDDMVEMLVASGLSVQEGQKEGEDKGKEGEEDDGISGKEGAAMDVDEEAEGVAPAAEIPVVAASRSQAPAKDSARVASSKGDGRTQRADIEMGDLSMENLEALNLDEDTKKVAVELRGQMQGIGMARTALDRELEKLSERLREVLGRARA